MKGYTPAALALLLAACAPHVSDIKEESTQVKPVSLDTIKVRPKENRPKMISQGIPNLTNDELEKTISYLLDNGMKEIVDGPTDSLVKKETRYSFTFDDTVQAGPRIYYDRDISFCVKELRDGRRVYNLEVYAVYAYRSEGKVHFNKVRIVDGVLKEFNFDTLTFQYNQIKIDGYPDNEDEGYDVKKAVILNVKPRTWRFGADHFHIFTHSIRQVSLKYKGLKHTDLDNFPQSLGYPLYKPPTHQDLKPLPVVDPDPESPKQQKAYF